MINDRIPVLDVADFLAEKPNARQALAEAVAHTCADTGFLIITNHGIARSLIDGAFAAASDFFDMNEEAKLELKVGDLNIGYLPYGAQTIRTSKINNNTKPNLSESFYIVSDRSPDDPEILSGNPLYGVNKWPLGMPSFKATDHGVFRRDAASGAKDGLPGCYLPRLAR